MIKRIRECLYAWRYDFYLFRKYGIYSAKKQKKMRKALKCPTQSVVDSMHIIPDEILEEQAKIRFEDSPKISIITPLFNTDRQFLEEMLDSVQRQVYTNWELCLADGSTDDAAYVGEICRLRAGTDPRIIYKKLEKNEGISENTNACIAMSTGDFIALLDHDDLLHPSALFEVVKAINEEKADFVYTDEVKFKNTIEAIDNPLYFNLKPGFSKYDLRSHNYICHFTVFSKKLLHKEKLYQKQFDGSQDFDMVLRMTEKAKKIVHIPKVLYYWRMHASSVSMDLSVKPYAVQSAFGAINEQLARFRVSGKVSNTERLKTLYRIEYDIIGSPTVSIVFHGSVSETDLASSIERVLQSTAYRPLEIVYSCSEDIAFKCSGVSFTNIGEQDWKTRSEMWNCGIRAASGEHIVLLDASVFPLSDMWLSEMLMYSQKNDVHAVGPKIFYYDNSIAYAGISLSDSSDTKLVYLGQNNSKSDDGYEAMLRHVRRTSAAVAECMMFSKAAWEMVGGFSDHCPEYEDIDFCLKGMFVDKCNVWTCFAALVFEGRVIEKTKETDQIKLFEKEYAKLIEKDDTYHPGWKKLHVI